MFPTHQVLRRGNGFPLSTGMNISNSSFNACNHALSSYVFKCHQSTPKYTSDELSQLMAVGCDPFELVKDDLGSLSAAIKSLLGSDHPVLESCAKLVEQCCVGELLIQYSALVVAVILVSVPDRCVAAVRNQLILLLVVRWFVVHRYFFDVDGGKKIRPAMVLAVSYALNFHAQAAKAGDEQQSSNVPSPSPSPSGTRVFSASPQQKRLAEITEMIHTASLFHDDVIDKVVLSLLKYL